MIDDPLDGIEGKYPDTDVEALERDLIDYKFDDVDLSAEPLKLIT